MKIAYVMRGVPGSGKSTFVKTLVREEGIVHSTDDYFYIDGKYMFDRSRLQEYHDRNFAAFCESLKNGIPVVVCDNTNGKHCFFERYVKAAEEAGYEVRIITMPHPDPVLAASCTSHNVPIEKIQQMIDEWED